MTSCLQVVEQLLSGHADVVEAILVVSEEAELDKAVDTQQSRVVSDRNRSSGRTNVLVWVRSTRFHTTHDRRPADRMKYTGPATRGKMLALLVASVDVSAGAAVSFAETSVEQSSSLVSAFVLEHAASSVDVLTAQVEPLAAEGTTVGPFVVPFVAAPLFV